MENPRQIHELQMHPQKSLFDVIGPYFFENQDGTTVTVNGPRYRNMINNFVLPKLENIHIRDKWFQQDGATCQTAGKTMNLLHQTFPRSLILRNGAIN